MPNDGVKLLRLIKAAAVEAVQAGGTANFLRGTVTSTDPLIIELENKLPIPAECLSLTKNTTCWTATMDVDHQTEDAAGGSGDAQYASHHHAYKGTKHYRVHNELAVGDKVILGRCEGGQHYVVNDRDYNPDTGCSDR